MIPRKNEINKQHPDVCVLVFFRLIGGRWRRRPLLIRLLWMSPDGSPGRLGRLWCSFCLERQTLAADVHSLVRHISWLYHILKSFISFALRQINDRADMPRLAIAGAFLFCWSTAAEIIHVSKHDCAKYLHILQSSGDLTLVCMSFSPWIAVYLL